VGELCNACDPGETCGNNKCVGGGSGQVSHSTPPSPSTSVPVHIPSSTKLIPSHASSASAPSPTVVPSVGTFNNIGCYADSPDARVLTNGSRTDSSSTGITVEKCAALAKGYQFAGVEYSR
jgi:hypothetical protein